MKPFNKGKKFDKKAGAKRGKKDFKRPFPGHGGGFEKPYNSRDFGRPQGRGAGTELFEAVCAECGEPCEVPFKPTGNRPVLCRSCFRQQEGGEGANRFEGRGTRGKPRERFREKSGGGPSADVSGQLADINRKLDIIIEALEIDID
jgi:CxxC-x17-CxxC domain-containing protein